MGAEGEIKKRKGQVRPRVRDALVQIVTHGLSISDAAQSVGMCRESLSRALKRPAVREARVGIERAWREQETSKAWLTMASLASTARSEDVSYKAARFLIEQAAEAEGRMPAQTHQAVQIIINSQHPPLQPTNGQLGGVVELPPFAPGDADA